MKRALMLLSLLAPIFVSGLVTTIGWAETEIMPRPPKPMPVGSDLARLVRDTRVGDGYAYRQFVVYPLFTTGRGEHGVLTMDEAVSRGLLQVTEKGEGSVPELLVENRADEPIFLLAGEIVKGGKQNRVIAQDVLLAPRSGPIGLGVFCVEQGRWVNQTERFEAESAMAHGYLRQKLNAPVTSQSEVWGEVSRKAAAVAPSAATGSRYLGKVFEDKSVQLDVDEYIKPITLPSDANGMAVVIGGQVAGVEIFGDRDTFAKLQAKLLRSYAVDALECKGAEKGATDHYVVEQFLRRAGSARLTQKETVGIGQFFKIEGGGLYGSLLRWHEQSGAHRVVHVSLFEQMAVTVPTPKPHPPIVPFER
jgi:hypothetical protein